MNNQIFKKAAVATVGVVTVISLSVASAPAFAKGHGHNPAPLVQTVKHGGHALKLGGAVEQGNEHGAPVQTADLAFTVTGVPPIITDPAQIANNIIFKVIPLPADATSAPATPPALTREQNKFDGKFRLGSSNQTPLTLDGTTISGSIQIRGLRSGAGVQNLAVYPFLAADSRSGLDAQAGTPVFVVATTAIDGTVSLSGQSGDLTLDLTQNTGTIKSPQTATVNVPDNGGVYALQIVRVSFVDKFGNTVTDTKAPVVASISLTTSGTQTVNLPDLRPGTYTFNLIQLSAQLGNVTVGSDGTLSTPVVVG